MQSHRIRILAVLLTLAGLLGCPEDPTTGNAEQYDFSGLSGPNVWIPAHAGLKTPFEVAGMVSRFGATWAAVNGSDEDNSGIYSYDNTANTWNRVMARPVASPVTALCNGPADRLYAVAGGRVFSLGTGETAWVEPASTQVGVPDLPLFPNVSVLDMTASKTRIFLRVRATTNAALQIWMAESPGRDAIVWRQLNSAGLPTTDAQFTGPLALDGFDTVYVPFLTRSRDLWNAETSAMDAASKDGYRKMHGYREAVFALTLGATGWRDITWSGTPESSLDLGDLSSGVDAAPLDGLCNLNGTVYATTARGVYRWDQSLWTHIRFTGSCKLGAGQDCLVAAGLGGAGVLRGTTAMRVGQSNLRNNAYNEFDYPTTPDDGGTLFVRFRTPGINGSWDDPYTTYILRLVVNTGRPVSDTNVNFDRASYLGGAGDDFPRSVKINGTGEILVAGDFSEAPGAVVSRLESAGAYAPGSVSRLDGSGRTVLATSVLGEFVTDVAVSDAGPVAVSGSFGAALLTGDLKTIVWCDTMADAPPAALATSRIAIGSDNTVAAVAGNMVYVWTSDGVRVAAVSSKHTVAADIEIAANLGLLFVTGHDEGMLDEKAMSVAWMEGRSLVAPETVVWRTWGFAAAELRDNAASTYGRRISIGPDGYLYFLGVAEGRNSIFRWNGLSLGGATALAFDVFNSLWNSDETRLAYYARMNTVTGEVFSGQFIIPRNRDSKAGNFNAWEGDICADTSGNMYIAGICDAGLEGRDTRTINGNPVGMFDTADPVLMITSPDFAERRVWTPLTAGAGCVGSTVGVAVRFGRVAVLARAENGTMFTTAYAGDTPTVTPNRSGGIDGWFGIFRPGF